MNRPVGIFALVHTTIVIALPRVYLGLHYPTDLIAGAAIGAAVAWLFVRRLSETELARRITEWSYSAPAYFYPAIFLATYQIADMFTNARELAETGASLLKRLVA